MAPKRGDKTPIPPPDDITTPVVDTGFKNVTAYEDRVEAQLTNEYHAPARGDVHITTGPGDTTGDGDQDGLSDAAEAKYGTNPHDYDSDRDGIADGVEVQIGTDPLNKLGDADKDGVPDATEIGQGMNPFDPDTDHDGISDAVEYDRYPFLATVPTPGGTDTDWDGDGLSNTVEDTYGQSKTIPEKNIPELQRLTDLSYERRLQLNPDPVHQAIVAADLQRELTPAQEAALLDAVYEHGIANENVFARYSMATQLEVIDGTPIPAELQAEYDKAVAARDQAARDGLPTATLVDVQNLQRGVAIGLLDPTLQGAIDARFSAIKDLADQVLTTGDPRAIAQLQVAIPGITLTTDVITAVSDDLGTMGYGSQSGSSGSDSGSTSTVGAGSSNPANDALGRMEWNGTSFVPVADDPMGPSTGDTGDAPAVPADVPASGTTAGSTSGSTSGSGSGSGSTEFVPDNTASQAADNLGGYLDGIAGQLAAAAPKSDLDMKALLDAPIGGSGTTTRGTTEDGRSYTQTDQGASGFKREYDDTNTVQFFNPDGTAKGGELHLSSDAGSTDGTNPYEGTTDNDGMDDGDEEEEGDGEEGDGEGDGGIDDGTSGTAVAYVNPDADVITVGIITPMVAQLVTTGVDPTTTTPSNPYVDDATAPVVVTSGVAQVGMATPMRPGVVDRNPDLEVISGGAPTFDPDGPDVVSPDDPLIGSGADGLDTIDASDLSPRAPTNAVGGGLMGEGPPEDEFDPG